MWTVKSVEHIMAAIHNVHKAIESTEWKIPTKSKSMTPMQSSFVPELDGSPEFSSKDHIFYHELIGICAGLLRLVELTFYMKFCCYLNTRLHHVRATWSKPYISLNI